MLLFSYYFWQLGYILVFLLFSYYFYRIIEYPLLFILSFCSSQEVVIQNKIFFADDFRSEGGALRKRLFSAFLSAFLGITGILSWNICSAAAPPDERPKLNFYFGLPEKPVYSKSVVDSPKSSYAFDPVLQFDVVRHDFIVRNKSDRALEFKKVEGCCGSLVESFTSQIPAGKEGVIKTLLFTNRRGGEEIRGIIRAVPKDPKDQEWIIEISCFVKKFADISAHTIMLNGPIGGNPEGSSTVFPAREYPFKITGLKPKKGLDFTCGYKEIKQGDRKGYLVWTRNKRTVPGVIWDTIFVQTNNPARPEFIIRVQGKITGQ
jgi:hypothetical protein